MAKHGKHIKQTEPRFRVVPAVPVILAIIAVVATLAFAATTLVTISARGGISVETVNVPANVTSTYQADSFDFTYEHSGDQKQVVVKTSNNTEEPLTKYFTISYDSGDDELAEAILVYQNGEFLGTLSEIAGMGIDDEYGVVIPASSSTETYTATDTFTFELHNAAEASPLDQRSLGITLSTYTSSIDYEDYIFVSDEDELMHAIDDVNSGLLEDTPLIVLCNDISLSGTYTIQNYTKIDLNGHTLSGASDAFTLEDDGEGTVDALVEFVGGGSFNAGIALGESYDSDGAEALLDAYITEQLRDGILAGGSVDALGPYDSYASIDGEPSCTTTACSYSGGVITASSPDYTSDETLTVNGTEYYFKVIGTVDSLIDETLAHLPDSGTEISGDLFLPTSIPAENAIIYWTSSDSSVMTSDGHMVSENSSMQPVTLYASIKVNDTVYTREFTYSVTMHNNEINFYKLVQEISPVVIENVYSGSNEDVAYYYLPIVDYDEDAGTFGTYDYRNSYETPSTLKSYIWNAYNDIGLVSLTYSMTEQQQTDYDYLSLDGNAVYLNRSTINNYGTITVTGDFGNGEVYSTDVNISMIAGSDTQLLEKAFTKVSEEIADVDILYNIVSTRIAGGMQNEKGDFSLSAAYTLDNNDYTVSYTIPDSAADIIQVSYNALTEKYDFTVNPEYFKSYESTVPILATVTYTESGVEYPSTRTFNVTIPAALHVSDFGTVSTFNSVKYQVFQQLPDNEKGGTSGFSVSGNVLTNNLPDYILLRDIDGDADYADDYDASTAYLTKLGYGASDYATGTEDLSFYTLASNNANATDTVAYDFVQLIEWATNDEVVSASSVVSDSSAISSLASTKSNGKSYLNDSELAVIKAFYCYYTGADDSAWTSVYNAIFNKGAGYVYQNSALMNEVIAQMGTEKADSYWNGGYFGSSLGGAYAKYLEILGRYAQTTSQKEESQAPSAEIYNANYLWNFSSTASSSRDAVNIKVHDGYWVRTSGTPSYNTSAYYSDKTTYITENELFVIRAFWLNMVGDFIDDSFSSTSLSAIEEVLSDNSDYYPDYTIDDFKTYGAAIANALDACLVVPIYFNSDGISQLVTDFYSGYSFNGSDYSLTAYGAETAKPFDSILVSEESDSGSVQVPAVTNLDGISSALSYFTNLEELKVYGNSALYAFLSENGLSTMFSRLPVNSTELDTLALEYVAGANNSFDPSNLKNYEALESIDLSNNGGLTDPNQLVTTKRGNYTYFDMSGIGADREYCDYAIDNIASDACTVWYTDEDGNRVSTNTSNASALADISDFETLVTEYMYATDLVYDTSGSSSRIFWRIDEGNSVKGLVDEAGEYEEINSITEMNNRVSPYYYCAQSFMYDGENYVAGHVYQLSWDSDNDKITADDALDLGDSDVVGVVDSDTDIPDSLTDEEIAAESTTQMDASETVTSVDGKATSSETTEVVIYDQTSSPYRETTVNYVVQFNCFYFYTTSGTLMKSYYYLQDNGTNLVRSSRSTSTKPNGNSSYFAFLSDEEAGLLENLISGDITEEDLAGATQDADGNYTFTLGVSQDDINGDDSYYMYCPYTQRYVNGGSNNSSVLTSTTYSRTYRANSINTTQKTTRLRASNNRYIYYNNNNLINSSSNYTTWTYSSYSYTDVASSSGAETYSKQITLDEECVPEMDVTYKDESTIDGSTAYSLGFTLTQESGPVQFTKICDSAGEQFTKTKYYYVGGNTVYKVDYDYKYCSRFTSVITGTYTRYSVEFWYKDVVNSSTKKSLGDMDSIDTIAFTYYEGTTTVTNTISRYITITEDEDAGTHTITEFDSDDTEITHWTIGPDSRPTPVFPDPTYGDATWNCTVSKHPYISNVTDLGTSSAAKSMLKSKAATLKLVYDDIECLCLYTGPTGSETLYKCDTTGVASMKYANNSGYSYAADTSNNWLRWTKSSTTPSQSTSGTTMMSILAEANSHFNDYLYGNYYGFYYGYSGTSQYVSGDVYLQQGYVYRIMPNAANTEFTWVEVGQYNKNDDSVTGTTAADAIRTVATGNAEEGDIFYISTSLKDNFFEPGWYKAVLNQQNDTLDLVKFTDLDITLSNTAGYTKFTNSKIAYRADSRYLGVSGVFTVGISAVIKTDGAEFVKMYKLKEVGSIVNNSTS